MLVFWIAGLLLSSEFIKIIQVIGIGKFVRTRMWNNSEIWELVHLDNPSQNPFHDSRNFFSSNREIIVCAVTTVHKSSTSLQVQTQCCGYAP